MTTKKVTLKCPTCGDNIIVSADKISDVTNESSVKIDIVTGLATETMDYFNKVTGRKCRVTKNTIKPIKARIKDQLAEKIPAIEVLKNNRRVIDKKYMEWKDNPKMKHNIRISTLFRACHFDEYLSQVDFDPGDKPKTQEQPCYKKFPSY